MFVLLVFHVQVTKQIWIVYFFILASTDVVVLRSFGILSINVQKYTWVLTWGWALFVCTEKLRRRMLTPEYVLVRETTVIAFQ